MSRLTEMITRRGDATLAWLAAWGRILRFASTAVLAAFSPALYNSATRTVVQKQIYFTAWQILGTFTVFATVLSLVIIQISVSTAREFGLGEYALEVVIRALVIEILPLLTALFVALRSGAAINTEVALMNINNEIRALEEAGVDPMRFEFMPRVIGGTISMLALTALASILALVLGYVTVYGLQSSSLLDFGRVMGKVFTIPILLGLWLKCLAFGIAVTAIPIAAGLQAPQKLFFAPIAVLQGMVRLFFVLMIIEVGALALTYI